MDTENVKNVEFDAANAVAYEDKRNVEEPNVFTDGLLKVLLPSLAWSALHTRKDKNGRLYKTTQSQRGGVTIGSTKYTWGFYVNASPAGESERLSGDDIALLKAIKAGKGVDGEQAKALLNTLISKLG